ncbi:MAG: bifunctional folylpolyglutamate synthase/dihydrofolate synthase [Akkermansiaceae bacterium]|nr:bifunctional folylpolyglutamate synthase/dihydrofolate synthase [Akkermansiaceae bacterium]
MTDVARRMTYREAIDWLFSTQMFGIKLGLDGPRRLLTEFLAHPAHGVKVIHVAGTNGKGSTCAMIDRIARSAGWRSGLFTSPHLIDYRERIQVSGEQIPEEECADMLTALRTICERLDPHPTFFEITLALAMRWFRERGCEIIVLETGMGGRLDATTAVEADVCAVTPIGLDHTQWLGGSIEEIAAEKAGIFLPGKPALSSPQEPAAAAVLEKHANLTRAPFEFITEPLRGYPIALTGEHQAWNAALAVAALAKAGLPLSYDVVRHGLESVRWPGRFEEIEAGLILDGAHNPHAARVLAETWGRRFPNTLANLVFSAVAAKDVRGILEHLAPLAREIFLCPVDTPRALSTTELAGFLPPSRGLEFPDLAGALEAARASRQENHLPILIAGSLFLVGEAKALIAEQGFRGFEQ